jgi:hypothetical protein
LKKVFASGCKKAILLAPMSNPNETKPTFSSDEVIEKMEVNLDQGIKDYKREILRLEAKIEEATANLTNLRYWKNARS